MQGLSNGLALSTRGSTATGQTLQWPIVAWGDSLTQGAGATDGQTFLVQLAALLEPGRTYHNQGIGGQDASAIAARQGGMPITVSVENNLVPARPSRSWMWSFNADFEGATHAGTERGGTMTWLDGQIVVDAPSWLQGVILPLNHLVPNGTGLEVSVQITVPPGMSIRASGILDDALLWAANDGSGSEGKLITTSGTHSFTLFAGGVEPGRPSVFNQLVFLTEVPPSGESIFSIESISASTGSAGDAVAVLSRSVEAINAGGNLAGTLAGVPGTMWSDAGGDWHFNRNADGPAVVCPPGSLFTPDAATAQRRHTNIIWVGNNGVLSPDDAAPAAAQVVAMISHLQHNRYLVLGALPRPDRVDAIAALNALLSGSHGERFLDVLSDLQAARDGSADDEADITAGLVPRSLRADDIHLTNAGYAVVAQILATEIATRRW